jgi:hypothetical protein
LALCQKPTLLPLTQIISTPENTKRQIILVQFSDRFAGDARPDSVHLERLETVVAEKTF